jgi:hypothetical protein
MIDEIIPKGRVGHNNLDGTKYEIGTGRELVKRRINGRVVYTPRWGNHS